MITLYHSISPIQHKLTKNISEILAKSLIFSVVENHEYLVFPKSSPRPFCGVRKCGKKLEKHRISFEIRCFYGCGGRT